jgi:phospholipase C
MGGAGANHVMMGTGDDVFWSDGNGNPTTPPAVVIANPDPQPGTNDVYTVDLNFNGDFANCSDPSQPGIDAIHDYPRSLPYHPKPNCEEDHFYLINNENPGFLPDGTVDTAGITSGASVPPSNVRTIGDALNEKGISWAYYGGAYNAAIALQHDPTSKNPLVQVGAAYCNICNFESYATSIMGDAAQRTAHIKDATDFFAAVDNSTLPAVSFVKPDGLLDGHPASSSSTSSKPCSRKSWTISPPIRRSLRLPFSSSPRTKVAASTTPVTFSRWTSLAMVHASRCSPYRPGPAAGTSATCTPTTSQF